MEQEPSAIESNCVVNNSKISALINTIVKMTKHPSIESDLSQVLDNFLLKISECDSYLENGIFNMNFAEAALLLQSSADIYSKKVDLLWDIIFDYQKRMLLSEEQDADKEQEIEKLEERKRKYKRKRKTNADETQATKLVNNFSFGNGDNFDYLNQSYEQANLLNEWKKFHSNKQTSHGLQGQGSNKSLFLPDSLVHTEDNDYVGRYDQFHSASVIDEIFHLEKENLLADDLNCVTNMRIDSYIVNDFLAEKSIPANKSQEMYSKELDQYITHFMNSHKKSGKDLHNNTLQLILSKQSYVCLERLPCNITQDRLRRSSVADSVLDDDHFSTGDSPCPCNLTQSVPKDCSDVTETSECSDRITGAVENRSKSCSQDSAFYEDMDEQNNNDASDVVIPETVDANKQTDVTVASDIPAIADVIVTSDATATTNVMSGASVKILTDCNPETVGNSIAKNTEISKSTVSKLSPVSQLCCRSTIVTRAKPAKRWASILAEGEDQEEKIKKRKLLKKKPVSEKELKKLATGMTTILRDFEKFCRLQYRPAVGEGSVPQDFSESEESEDDDHHEEVSDLEEPEVASCFGNDQEMSDFDERDDEMASSLFEKSKDRSSDDPVASILEGSAAKLSDVSRETVSPAQDIHVPNCNTREEQESFQETASSSCLETPRKSMLLFQSDGEMEQEEISRKNVREWRTFILPKLKTMENKSDFDIHEYGSNIIDSSRIGEERYFKDIVKGKSSPEVARYFIATLQLANTYNVEIMGAISGQIANDNFQIKTLDKTRYHELLEDYQAPSEETFRERLERAQASNPKFSLHSTPVPAKKSKLTIFSRKKLF